MGSEVEVTGYNLQGVWVPIEVLEHYLGPQNEWRHSDVALAPARLRSRGWGVADTDRIIDTAAQMVAGTLPTMEERWPNN